MDYVIQRFMLFISWGLTELGVELESVYNLWYVLASMSREFYLLFKLMENYIVSDTRLKFEYEVGYQLPNF